MQCPKCRLENPPTAQRCDCGYDFESGKMEKSYLNDKVGLGRKAGRWLLTLGWIFAILGGWLGVIIALNIAYSKDNTSDPLHRTYQYDEASRAHGKVMLCVSLGVAVLAIAARGLATAIMSTRH